MIYDLDLMRRAAKIAGNTECWIGMGCVIAKGGKILAEAWNETLKGEEYCVGYRTRIKKQNSKGLTFSNEKVRPSHTNEGCIRHDLNLSQGKEIEKACSIHAEANAIAKATREGTTIDGATMFITSFPCLICMRSIIAAGIKKVVYMNDFYKPHHEEMFEKNNVKIEQIIENKVWKYNVIPSETLSSSRATEGSRETKRSDINSLSLRWISPLTSFGRNDD